MTHNALITASAALPARDDERRRLGLPTRRRGPRPGARRPALAFRWVRLEAVPPHLAALFAGIATACGGSAETAPDRPGRGALLLLGGDAALFVEILRRAARRPETRAAAAEIEEVLRHFDARPGALRLRRGALPLGRRVPVMGILNVTPDSFSDGGRFLGPRRAVEHAVRMAEEGAAIIDVGGESTRPGSRRVPLREELRRVMPVLEAVVPALARLGPRRPLLSIDTTKAEVARRAAEAGVDVVNDISGLTFDPAMPAAVAESGLPVVIGHIRKRPETMQRAPRYRHLLPEIAAFLRRGIVLARRAGVREDRIAVDPGIGFGKRRRDNLVILRHLASLRSLGRPILVGASRKSFLSGPLDLPVTERLEGSLAAEALAIAGGADIIRAHDVRPAVRVADLCSAVLRGRDGRR